MRLLLLCTIVSFIGFTNCNSSGNSKKSASLRSDKDCLPIIEQFFNKIQKGKYKEAIDSMLLTNPYINIDDSMALDLRQKFYDVNQYSGKFFGYGLVKKKEVVGDISIYSYVAKYEKKFYRYIFIFYKADKVVRLYKFTFNDGIDLELEEALRLYHE